MLVTTTFSFEGRRIVEYKGIVRGIIVRAPTIGRGSLAVCKTSLAARSQPTRKCASRRDRRPTT